MSKNWYTESDTAGTTAPSWEALTGTGPDQLAAAAAVGPTIGRADRTVLDHLLVAVIWLSLLAVCCGAVPAALLAVIAWRIQIRRSRVLDRPAWESATPTAGARRYRTREVAEPRELDPPFRSHRWWAVVGDSGEAVFGLVGSQFRLATNGTPRRSCIVPGGPSFLGSVQPVPVPEFWKANIRFLGQPAERGYSALHLCRADGRPALAVRFADPSRRDVIEVLVYGDGLGEDEATAVLSCVALFRARLRPGKATDLLEPAPPVVGGPRSWGSPVGVDGVTVPAPAPGPVGVPGGAWPAGFIGTGSRPDAARP